MRILLRSRSGRSVCECAGAVPRRSGPRTAVVGGAVAAGPSWSSGPGGRPRADACAGVRPGAGGHTGRRPPAASGAVPGAVGTPPPASPGGPARCRHAAAPGRRPSPPRSAAAGRSGPARGPRGSPARTAPAAGRSAWPGARPGSTLTAGRGHPPSVPAPISAGMPDAVRGRSHRGAGPVAWAPKVRPVRPKPSAGPRGRCRHPGARPSARLPPPGDRTPVGRPPRDGSSRTG